MKLIIQNGLIVATATDDYNGPDQWIAEPADFDILLMSQYRLVNGVLEIPLATAQAAQLQSLYASYLSSISQPVSFTTSPPSPVTPVTKTYQADPVSIANLNYALEGYRQAGATPSGFYWVAADNTQVPFTYSDLGGLAAVIMANGWTQFQKLQTLKKQVNAATTSSAAFAVVW